MTFIGDTMFCKIFAAAAGALIALVLPGSAMAESYPGRTVRFIVPYPAGGPTDAIARALAEPLQAALGQAVVIENRARRRRATSASAKPRMRRRTAIPWCC